MSFTSSIFQGHFLEKNSLIFSMNDNYAGIYLFSTQKYAKKYLLYSKIYLLKKILISWGFAAETLLVITAHSKQARDGSELGAGVGNILILNGE